MECAGRAFHDFIIKRNTKDYREISDSENEIDDDEIEEHIDKEKIKNKKRKRSWI